MKGFLIQNLIGSFEWEREGTKPCFIEPKKENRTIFSLEDPNTHPVINLTSSLSSGNAHIKIYYFC
jgi:hypothetical protein